MGTSNIPSDQEPHVAKGYRIGQCGIDISMTTDSTIRHTGLDPWEEERQKQLQKGKRCLSIGRGLSGSLMQPSDGLGNRKSSERQALGPMRAGPWDSALLANAKVLFHITQKLAVE